MSTPPQPVADPAPEAPGGAEAPESLGRAAAAGALWLFLQKWAVRISGLVTIAFLTRQLSPAEFGVVAAANALIPLVLLLSDLGLSTYLTQAGSVTRKALDTAFWLSVAFASVLGVALVAAAPLVAAVLGIPESADVLRVLSGSVLVVVLGSVPTALLRRRMAFKRLAVQGTVAAVLGQVVAVVVALADGGVWALVLQLVTAQTVITLLAWWSARWRPGIAFSREELGRMTRYGVSVVAIELISTGRAAAETAVIANTLGPVPLGYLSVAQRLVQVMQDLGAAAVVPVTTVVFAKIRDSRERLAGAYLRATRLAYAAILPVMGLAAVGSAPIIDVLFGRGWGGSVAPAQALAVAAVFTLGAVVDHGFFYGTGRPGTWLVYAAATDAVTFTVTLLAAPHGIAAVTWGFATVAATATVVRVVMLGKILALPRRTVAGPLLGALAPAAVSVGVGWAAISLLPADRPLLRVVSGVAVIGLVHLLAMRLLIPQTLRSAIELLPLPGRLRAARWRPGR